MNPSHHRGNIVSAKSTAQRLIILSALGVLLLAACTAAPIALPEPLVAPRARPAQTLEAPAAETVRSTGIDDTPKPPTVEKNSTLKMPVPAPDTKSEQANITVAFDQIALPEFIQAVYGLILKKQFTVDPQVVNRKDLVTFRAAREQSLGQIEAACRLLLKSYGIAVIDLGTGFFRIAPDNNLTGYSAEILRGRALPDVPLPMRPIFQLVEMQAVRSSEVMPWLKTIFPQKITLMDDPAHNALLISGQPDDIAPVLEAIRVLDQTPMKGRQSLRINPAFWAAEELTKKLAEILQTEGYGVSIAAGGAGQQPISLLPIQGINAIIVFATDPALLKHIVDWSDALDKPNENRGATSSGYFTYQVRNTNAETLAKTMQDLLSGMAAATPTPSAVASLPGTITIGAPPQPARNSRVVVNNATNTLIFQSGTENYTQLINLLRELDKPAKSALIEVTVAEVTLDDSTQLGVEWALSAAGIGSPATVGGTAGGIALGPNTSTIALGAGRQGLTLARLNSLGNLKALVNALATNSRANVLSSPRILARSGEEATIQVGSKIPTITAQQTGAATGGTGVIQSVQYLDTGVILKVKPIIYAGDRIDLDISQEVSNSNTVGVAGSPIVNTRKVTTRLSLKDGSPVLLGGLISQAVSRSDTGVPLLMDVPVLGQLFRVNTDKSSKTELLVLITPYIVADDHDARAITDAFQRQITGWGGKNSPAALENIQSGPAERSFTK